MPDELKMPTELKSIAPLVREEIVVLFTVMNIEKFMFDKPDCTVILYETGGDREHLYLGPEEWPKIRLMVHEADLHRFPIGSTLKLHIAAPTPTAPGAPHAR